MKRVLQVFTFLFFLTAVPGCESQSLETELRFARPDGETTPTIYAEIANTPSSRELGLMYRKELAPDRGMLFIFPDEQPRSFWMKNTYLELDMIFLDRNLRVVSVIHRAKPLTEDSRASERPAMYVLETPGGIAAQLGISAGSNLQTTRPLPDGE